jgi:hypothetical protein
MNNIEHDGRSSYRAPPYGPAPAAADPRGLALCFRFGLVPDNYAMSLKNGL